MGSGALRAGPRALGNRSIFADPSMPQQNEAAGQVICTEDVFSRTTTTPGADAGHPAASDASSKTSTSRTGRQDFAQCVKC